MCKLFKVYVVAASNLYIKLLINNIFNVHVWPNYSLHKYIYFQVLVTDYELKLQHLVSEYGKNFSQGQVKLLVRSLYNLYIYLK